MIHHSPPAIVRSQNEQTNREVAIEVLKLIGKSHHHRLSAAEADARAGRLMIRLREKIGDEAFWSWVYSWKMSKRKVQCCMQIARIRDARRVAECAHIDAMSALCGKEFPPEPPRSLRQPGDEPEQLDETPLPRFCDRCKEMPPTPGCLQCAAMNDGQALNGHPAKSDKPLKARWRTWTAFADRTTDVLNDITAVIPRARDTDDYQAALRAAADYALAVGRLKEQFTGRKIHLNRSA